MVVSRLLLLTGLLAGLVSPSSAVDTEAPWIAVEFPRDSPIVFVSAKFGPNQAARGRGMSMTSDLHGEMMLRNTSSKLLTGLTLRVDSANLGPGVTASVTLPGLRTAPGETIPMRIDAALIQPMTSETLTSASLRLSLDCAEFSDGTTFGPDSLDTEQQLRFYQAEAHRDRNYLSRLLVTGEVPRLREALNFGLLDTGRTLAGLEILPSEAAGTLSKSAERLLCRNYESAPVIVLSGSFRHVGSQLRDARVTVVNRSSKPVKRFEVAYLVGTQREGLFFAGTVPSIVNLVPGQQFEAAVVPSLRVVDVSGEPLNFGSLVAFAAKVTFNDGSLWIPSRDDFQRFTTDPALRRALSFSPEQQRLAELYHRDSIAAVIRDLQGRP